MARLTWPPRCRCCRTPTSSRGRTASPGARSSWTGPRRRPASRSTSRRVRCGWGRCRSWGRTSGMGWPSGGEAAPCRPSASSRPTPWSPRAWSPRRSRSARWMSPGKLLNMFCLNTFDSTITLFYCSLFNVQCAILETAIFLPGYSKESCLLFSQPSKKYRRKTLKNVKGAQRFTTICDILNFSMYCDKPWSHAMLVPIHVMLCVLYVELLSFIFVTF